MRCNANHTHLCKLIGNQTQKQEIATTLVFVCTGH